MKPLQALKRIWSTSDAFTEHRLRTVLTAVGVAVLSTVLLVVGPETDARLGTVWVTVFAAALSIALVTLLYELFLRESHAVALHRFIQLDAAVVNTALRTIDEESDVDWRHLYEVSSTMTFVLVRPYRAVNQLNDILRAARGRKVDVKFCFPDLPDSDPETPDLGADSATIFTQAIGGDARLGSSIASTVEDMISTFDREGHVLESGSTLEVAVYKAPSFMEGILLDRATILMPFECRGRPRGSEPICFVFGDGRSPEIERYRGALSSLASTATLIESKVADNS